MSICKIGETKTINGKRYRKEACGGVDLCFGCSLHGDCPDGGETKAIEEGGSECMDTIWILADDQPEAPTTTPPRDELREQRRFEAAKAAMQGAYKSVMEVTPSATAGQSANIAKIAVILADALLAELDRTGAGK